MQHRCSTGPIVCDEVVQNPEKQSRKNFSRGKTIFPDGSNILFHIAEVLRQVEGDGLERSRWFGRYAWFESTSSCE